ncbi:MAG: lysophospholipid acyltransferase family protein [Nitrospinae bacterium]|nr:lysophospholipid acyltransferase family protein [Nitrospinota bacterium]
MVENNSNSFFLIILYKIIFFVVYVVNSTLRYSFVNREGEKRCLKDGKSIVYSAWHGNFFALPYVYRWNGKYANLVSPSKDGEIITQLSNDFGINVIRGSSYKQPTKALYEMKKWMEEGNHVLSIGDGSRGPFQKLQKGTPLLAKMTGSPLILIASDFSRKITFNSWDKFKVPLPFSKVVFVFSDPIYVDSDLSKAELKVRIDEIEKLFLEITSQAERYFK